MKEKIPLPICEHPQPRAGRGRDDAGFTLIESLMAAAVLAFVVASLTGAVVAGQMSSYGAIRQQRAVSLANAMIERVLALPYQDPAGVMTPGPEPGKTSPAQFNNMSDFDGYQQPAGSLTDAAQKPYPQPYQTFSRAVSCRYTSINVPALGGRTNGLMITVTVTDDGGRQWVIHRFVPKPAVSAAATSNNGNGDSHSDDDHDHGDSHSDDDHGHDHSHSDDGHGHDHSHSDDGHGHDHSHSNDDHGHDHSHSDDGHGHDHSHSNDDHGHDHSHSDDDHGEGGRH